MIESHRPETNGEQTARGGDRTGRPDSISSTLRRVGFLVAAVTVLLAVASGAVAAHDNVPQEPGASGYCDNANGDGGSFAAHVGDHENNAADAQEAQSAAQMAVYFTQTGGECGGSDDKHIEAHTVSAQQNVQYCYDEQSDGDNGDEGRGGDPTDPTTAGAGAGEINVNDGSRNYPPGHEENENGDNECEYNAHNKPSIEKGDVAPADTGAGETTTYTGSFEYDPAKNGDKEETEGAALNLSDAVSAGGSVGDVGSGDVTLTYDGEGELSAESVRTEDTDDDGDADTVVITFDRTITPSDGETLDIEVAGVENPNAGEYTAELRSYASVGGTFYGTTDTFSIEA